MDKGPWALLRAKCMVIIFDRNLTSGCLLKQPVVLVVSHCAKVCLTLNNIVSVSHDSKHARTRLGGSTAWCGPYGQGHSPRDTHDDLVVF